mmetsp:Transcript_97497/g.275803  ORF Transcript_97497/g.275803 Transcript_97497/m.275803 type:complete len:225 (-) Transcript_97497:423-1097(-)
MTDAMTARSSATGALPPTPPVFSILSVEVAEKCFLCSSCKKYSSSERSLSSPAFAASRKRAPPSRISFRTLGEFENATRSTSDSSTMAILTIEQKRSRYIHPLLPVSTAFAIPKGALRICTSLAHPPRSSGSGLPCGAAAAHWASSSSKERGVSIPLTLVTKSKGATTIAPESADSRRPITWTHDPNWNSSNLARLSRAMLTSTPSPGTPIQSTSMCMTASACR